jgi:hypothetical protein
MEAAAHSRHDAHQVPLPSGGAALNSVAFSATLHCLTGCAIGEVTGMIIGTALGFSDLGTIALAVGLAFLFGYTLTSLPLLRAGLTLGAVVPIALATDTFSIAVMEIVDNGIMLAVPGAMESGVGDILFWGALSIALAVAGVVAFPVNRWLIARGRGHAVLHETGIHGGPPVRLVAFVAAAMAVFGTAVLVGEAVGGGDEPTHGGGHSAMGAEGRGEHAGSPEEKADPVRGLAVADVGLKLEPELRELPRGRRTTFAFRIVGSDGKSVRDFEVEHEKRMHLIVARRDMTGFQHLHPEMAADGRWSTDMRLDDAGSYRVFADFKRDGENHTLAADLPVDGPLDSEPMAPAARIADAGDGYRVELAKGAARAGEEAELAFTATRNGKRIEVDEYLGAKGHLVALREGDLAYLHVHPSEGRHDEPESQAGHAGEAAEPIRFETEFPSEGRYGLFLQFKHEGEVRTAAFTREVTR